MHNVSAHELSVWVDPDCGSSFLRQLYGVTWSTIGAPDLIYLIPELCRPDVMREEGAIKLLNRLEGIKFATAENEVIIKRMVERLEALNAPRQQNIQRQFVTVTLNLAIEASMVAAFNSGYIFAEHAYAHETLSAAAWLGLLGARRKAVLPWALAEAIENIASTFPKMDPDDLISIEQCARQAQRTSQPGMIELHGCKMVSPSIERRSDATGKQQSLGLRSTLSETSIQSVRR